MKLPNLGWVDWSALCNSTITIQKRVVTGRNELNEDEFSSATVYAGPATTYSSSGGIGKNEAGLFSEMTLRVAIPAATAAALPAVPVGARVTVDGDPASYEVTWAFVNGMAPCSLELKCELASG